VTLILTTTLGDFTHHADFVEPAFGLFGDAVNLHKRLFAALSHHGVRLADMRWDQGGGTLGDANLLCHLFNFAVVLRVRLERVEIQCVDLNRINAKQLTQAGLEILNVLEGSEPGIRFKTHSFAMNFHGFLKNGSTTEFIGRFVSLEPSDLGPHVGSGVVFYFGAQGSRLSSSVTFDLSARLKEGLYFKVQSVWDAGKLPTNELPAALSSHVRDVLSRFDLEWEQPAQG
jgi:hypothetical protein